MIKSCNNCKDNQDCYLQTQCGDNYYYWEPSVELFNQLEKDHETSVRQADELILKVKELEDSLESVCHSHTSIEAQFYDLKKENEELKELVEKLKNCENCKHSAWDYESCICERDREVKDGRKCNRRYTKADGEDLWEK